MASILGLLEEREAAARVRAEELREAVALAAAALEAAEVELERRVIAREELVDALAVSADVAGCGTPLIAEAGSAEEIKHPDGVYGTQPGLVPPRIPGRRRRRRARQQRATRTTTDRFRGSCHEFPEWSRMRRHGLSNRQFWGPPVGRPA